MRRRTIGLLSSTFLLPFATFLAITGLISDYMDLNEFIYHKYAGYVTVGLAGIHVIAHWNQLSNYWKKNLFKRAGSRTFTRQPRSSTRGSEHKTIAPITEADVRHPSPTSSQPKNGMDRRSFLALIGTGMAGLLVGWLVRGSRTEQESQIIEQDLGRLYHRWSSPGYRDVIGAVLNWGRQPPRYKEFAWAELLPLPPVKPPTMTLNEALTRRRSLRDYDSRALSLEELSWLLYCATGITAPVSGFRAAPSAGAQFPIETYVVANRVESLLPGLYHYAVDHHALHRLREGNLGTAIMRAGLGQEFLAQAGVVFVLTAIFQRLRWRYRERTYRYALLEAGHIGQNIYLAAEAANLGACAVGAYYDDEVNQLLEVDGEQEATLYLLAVGPR